MNVTPPRTPRSRRLSSRLRPSCGGGWCQTSPTSARRRRARPAQPGAAGGGAWSSRSPSATTASAPTLCSGSSSPSSASRCEACGAPHPASPGHGNTRGRPARRFLPSETARRRTAAPGRSFTASTTTWGRSLSRISSCSASRTKSSRRSGAPLRSGGTEAAYSRPRDVISRGPGGHRPSPFPPACPSGTGTTWRT